MKEISFILCFFSWGWSLFSQNLDPVKWKFTANKINEELVDLNFTARIDKGWYIYSQQLEEDGPIPTSINISFQDGVELIGTPREAGNNKQEGYDPLFGIQVIKYARNVKFTQRIRLLGKIEEINGYVEFMCCDNERCLPPNEVDFTFSFKKL